MSQLPKTDYFEMVYQVVRSIPYGRVTTYGSIAEALTLRSGARMVGWALNGCPPDVPAHRVVNRKGMLSGKIHFGGSNTMAQMLMSEGVQVIDDKVANFNEVFWKPPFQPIC